MEEYRVIRSARKTLSLEITEDLTVLVRDEFIRIAKDGSRLRCSLAPEAH